MSALSTIAYRLKTFEVFHPAMRMMISSGTPAARRLRAADRRRSWKRRAGTPAAVHRFSQLLRKSRIGLNTPREHVILRPLALHAVAEQLEQRTRLDCDLTSFPVLGRARVKPDGAVHEIHLTDAKIEELAYPPTVVIGSLQQCPEP